MYKISEIAKVRTDFERVFHTKFTPFYDGIWTVAFQKICIDIIKFDDWLHSKYGDYETDNKSMQEIVIEHYGTEGDELIIELL